jgi:hypothetical protein
MGRRMAAGGVTDATETSVSLIAFHLSAAHGALGRAVVRIRVGDFWVIIRGIEVRYEDGAFTVRSPTTKRMRQPFIDLPVSVADAVAKLTLDAFRDAVSGNLDVPEDILTGLGAGALVP